MGGEVDGNRHLFLPRFHHRVVVHTASEREYRVQDVELLGFAATEDPSVEFVVVVVVIRLV